MRVQLNMVKLPGLATSLFVLATLVLINSILTTAEGSKSAHAEPSSPGQSTGRTAGGLVSRWVLFGGEFSEDLSWLLGSYADLARDFVYKITPNGFPWDPLIDIFTGSADIIQTLLEIVKSEGGILGVSLALMLLGIFLPLVGLFFCLCRCCGQCGAVRREERIRQLSCSTGVVMGAFLLVISLAVVAAGCFTILSGERLSQSVMHFEGTVNSIMDDIDIFQSDLLTDLRQVGNISYIVDNIEDALQGAENAILDPITTQFEAISVPLNATVSQLKQDLTDPLTTLSGITGLLATTIAQLKADGSAFQTAVTAASVSLVNFRDNDCALSLPDSLYGVCAFIPGEGPFLPSLSYSMLNTYNLAPVILYPTIVDAALNAYSYALSEGNAALKEVKATVASASDVVFKDVGLILTDVQSTVETATEEVVSGLEESLGESLDTQAFRDQIKGYVDLIEDYDMYSYVAFIVFASIGFVMSLLCILGLLCGACGYKRTRRPSQRSNTSECGGQFMIWSMWWTFIFAVLFCVPTAVWFIIGANVTLLCDAMVDLSIFDMVVDNPALWDGKTLLDSLVQFGDSPLNLTARHFIEDCQDDQTLYEALHLSSAGLLDGIDGLDIQEFMPYVQAFTDNMTASISGLDLVGPIDLSLLLSAVVPPAFPLISLVLSSQRLKDLTQAVPTQETIDRLNVFINKTWEGYNDHGSSQPDFQGQVDYAEDIITEMRTLETMQAHLLTRLDLYENQVTFFEAAFYEVQNLTTDALPSLTTNTQDLQDFASDASNTVASSLSSFVDSLISGAEKLVNEPINKIENDIGRCGVVATAYEATVAEVCQHFLTGFNGLWLSTGIISICCLPIVILNVRLSKYVRRTKPAHVYRETTQVNREA